jgi:hypothetical protein
MHSKSSFDRKEVIMSQKYNKSIQTCQAKVLYKSMSVLLVWRRSQVTRTYFHVIMWNSNVHKQYERVFRKIQKKIAQSPNSSNRSEIYSKGNCHDRTAGLEVARMAREDLSKGPSATDRSDLWTGSHRIRKNPFVGTFWSPTTAVFITAGVPEAAAM